MATEKRLIDANECLELLGDAEWDASLEDQCEAETVHKCIRLIKGIPAVDAVEVVRCKDCRWAEPYERMDSKIGYYCKFCGHSFKYGTNWERLFNPIKESNDFCSYGERRTDGNS